MRDREEIKNMFALADEYIKDNPNVIEMSVDDIFDNLDDGSAEMRHIRWGVMVRAKMKGLNSYTEQNIVEFLANVKEKNLLAQYIGYILQEEYNISLLKIMVIAYKNNATVDILYVVEPNIPFEKELELENVYSVINILKENKGHKLLQQTLRNLSILIVSKEREDDIICKYIYEPTDILQDLVYYLGIELCGRQNDKVKDIVGLLLNQKSRRFDISAIDFLSRSVLYGTECFDGYIEDICVLNEKSEEYFLKLIQAFIDYLESCYEGCNREKIKMLLSKVIHGSIESKKFFSRAIDYRDLKSKECLQILAEFMDTSFEKDDEILKGLDVYLKSLLQKNSQEGMRCIKKIYEINRYNLGDSFFGLLPNACEELQKEQELLCEIAFDGILYGDLNAFTFGIKLYEKILVVSEMGAYIIKSKISDKLLIKIIRGILFFTINTEKMCTLIYESLNGVELTADFMKMCMEDIYSNYPGTFIKISKRYTESANEKQRYLADTLLQYDAKQRIKIEEGYNNTELRPSDQRMRVYHKAQVEQNNKINVEANNKSLFTRFFPSRTMKYGKRHAFVQAAQNGKYVFQVSNYVTHKVEMELPRESVNNPVEFYRLRNEYIGSRCNYETDN